MWQIYKWIEQLVYALRRYDDELLKNYAGLSALVCKMQGILFKIFQEEAFPKAYVLNRACLLVFGNMYKKDALTKTFEKINFHHDISRPMEQQEELKWIVERHVRLAEAKKAQKLTPQLRAQVGLELAGRRFHYDHNFKTMVEGLKTFKDVNIKDLEKQFEANVTAHNTAEKKSRDEYEGPDELEVYGHIPTPEEIKNNEMWEKERALKINALKKAPKRKGKKQC